MFGKKLGIGKKAEAPAEDDGQAVAEGPLAFSALDMKKARSWFAKAADSREKREYDYAIEAYIRGLDFWPEAVEEGHMQLRLTSAQRMQAGGKKPSMMDSLKKPMIGKDAKTAMLNAEQLWAKDPTNAGYLDGLIKNATKGGFLETARWAAPLVLDSLRRDKKLSTSRFKAFRSACVEGAEHALERNQADIAVALYEHALNALELLMSRNPNEMSLRDEQRDLSGKLTIAKGKYTSADSFRDSLQDAESQKLLHDSERVQQGEETLEALIVAARREVEANPGVASKVNALIDVLLKRERAAEEQEAIEILDAHYTESRNYSFKSRADDIRLRQLARNLRQMARKARGGADEDKQQYRLAAQEYVQAEVAIFRERVANYPTDQRLKYKLGAALMRAKAYDEAIPVLQNAQSDPRHRDKCRLMIGQCFFEKQLYSQATDILQETLAEHDVSEDDTGKELMYWLARSQEAAGQPKEAGSTYGKLLRVDYNYRDGDARARMEALKG